MLRAGHFQRLSVRRFLIEASDGARPSQSPDEPMAQRLVTFLVLIEGYFEVIGVRLGDGVPKNFQILVALRS